MLTYFLFNFSEGGVETKDLGIIFTLKTTRTLGKTQVYE